MQIPGRGVAIRLAVWLVLTGMLCGNLRAQWHNFPGGRWMELPPAQGEKPGFTRLEPNLTGILFTNRLTDDQGATNRTLYNGSGVASGDFDGDGLPDLVFAGLQSQVELYKNLGGWRFSNVTAQAGISVTNLNCRGVVLADITGDGALDLLLTANGVGVRCWENDGRGHFKEITSQAGVSSPFGSLTMALADVDGNGTLDLYVANNRTDDIRDQGQVQLRVVGGKPTVPPALTNRLVIIDGRLEEYGEPDMLLLNQGHGRFQQVPWTNGAFLDEAGLPLKRPPLDWGLTATFRDLNGDGFPDLYVCNDFWTPDRIWLGDGHGRFRAAPWTAFRQISGSSMGVDAAYVDEDDRPEIFVVDMLSRLPSWRKRQMAAQRDVVNLPGFIDNRPQSLRNTFFHGRPDNTFAEIANFAGLAASEWAWQPVFLDVDLDGRPDLLITTGHAHDLQDRDAERLVRANQKNYGAITNAADRRRTFTADLRANMTRYPPLNTPIVAFRNQGGLRFEDVTADWGANDPGVHHGIALADFDGDGDLDFVVNNLNSPASAYRNNSTAPRVAVRLRGLPPNTMAVGAKATLRGSQVPVQQQEVVAGGRYLSGSDPLLVFAAGQGGGSLELTIRWRSGREKRVTGLAANRLYEISESGGDAEPPPQVARPVRPWFQDSSDRLGHRHADELYDDFQRQSLLPWRLSQSGPGVAIFDLDGDGWEDLVIGSGAGGRLGVYRNDGHGGFAPVQTAPFNQLLPRDTTSILGLPTASGGSEVIVGASSYEDGMTNAACLLSFAAGNPSYRALLRDLPSSIGPLAATDMDGDGQVELFAGSRVLAARWPEAGASLLLRKRNGGWQPDVENSPILSAAIPVSSAVWTDLDNDGFPELLLVGEFSSPRLFHNQRGRLESLNPRIKASGRLAKITEMSQLTGLWISVAAGDFDNDGRADLILGNWGENGEERASPDRPLVVLAGEAGSSALALIETTYERGVLTPTRPFDELFAAIPFLGNRFQTYAEYSDAALDRVLGPELPRFRRYQAATLTSVLLLNRGDYFEARELPAEAQFAPAFGLCVADFDLDGNLDLVLAQNFFATRPGKPRLDGGRSLLLRGDGRGQLSTVDGSLSGLAVYGEQRGAAVADFDHDGRPDLVITQNAAATRFFHNTTENLGIPVHLIGPPGNPLGLGVRLRVAAPDRSGPALEIRAGSGYWSQDAPSVLVPRPRVTSRVEATWPGGRKQEMSFGPDDKSIVIRFSEAP